MMLMMMMIAATAATMILLLVSIKVSIEIRFLAKMSTVLHRLNCVQFFVALYEEQYIANYAERTYL